MTSHRSAHSPSVPQDHLQPQHSMKRPTFSQKLRRLRSLQIPDGRPLPSAEQPVFQSATSQAPSPAAGLQCFEGSSQAAECSGDLTDGLSFHSNTSWTSPSMTIADSISPASSLQLKYAPRSAQDYQPAFSSVNSPLTAQDVQQPGWISYSPAFPGDSQNTSAAELTSHNAFGTSYQAFPSAFQAMNIGLPYAQTDMPSTTSWFAGNGVADSWLYNTFQPTPEICWTQGAPAASSDLVCNVNTQPEFITPTQLVSHSSPVATISSVQSSPSIQTASAIRAPSIQHDDDDPFDNGRKTLHSISEERRQKDSILLKLRRQGLTYKEIKRRTGRTEAESTLRGQVRALSKPPQHRVRKPVWTRGDVRWFSTRLSNSMLTRWIRDCSLRTQFTGIMTQHHLHRRSGRDAEAVRWKIPSDLRGRRWPSMCLRMVDLIRSAQVLARRSG